MKPGFVTGRDQNLPVGARLGRALRRNLLRRQVLYCNQCKDRLYIRCILGDTRNPNPKESKLREVELLLGGDMQKPLGLRRSEGIPLGPSGEIVTAQIWRPSSVTIAIAAFGAFLLKLTLALRTYGTNDVYTFEGFLRWSQYLGVGLYRATSGMNHPPFILHVLGAMGWMAHATGIGFPFWLRIPGIVADPITLWLVWKILGARTQEPSIRWALLMLAASPALILVSGFHGNTDTILVLFLVLTVYLIERGRTGQAGAAFAVSMSIKVVPVILIPAIFLYLGNLRKRTLFFSFTGATLLLLWSPYVFQDPFAIAKNTLGYRSDYGHWGISYLAIHFLAPENWINRIFRRLGAYLLLAAIGGTSVWMNRIHPKPSLFSQIGLILFSFLAFSNAFGVQYMVWLVPWAVALGAVPVALFYTASGAFLVVVYHYWSEGFPWYLADSIRIGYYRDHLAYFHILCWFSVLWLVVVAWKKMLGDKPSVPAFLAHIPAFGRGAVIALCLLAFVVYPAARQWNRDSPRPGRLALDRVLRSVRARQYSELSSWLYTANRHHEVIATARQAVVLDPKDATAYSNIAASSAALGLWDQAIESAQQALRIQPDSALAQKNLAWALHEKQKEKPLGKP